MTEEPGPSPGPAAGVRLAAILALAVAVRALTAAQFSDSPLWGVYSLDTLYYRSWALRIAGGDWIGAGVFEQSPLYAYLLAAVYRVAGAREIAVLAFQMACGLVSFALVFDTTRRIYGHRAALLSGLIPEAEDAFGEALRIDPRHLAPRWELARIADRTGRPAEAVAHLHALVQVAPQDARALFALGTILARTAADTPADAPHREAEARGLLEEAVRFDPRLTGPWYQLGRLAWLAGDEGAARRMLQRALETDPGNEAVLRLLDLIASGPEPSRQDAPAPPRRGAGV